MVKKSDPENKEFKRLLLGYERFEEFASKKIDAD